MVTHGTTAAANAPLAHGVKALLIQCREIARTRLAGVLTDAIAKVEEELRRHASAAKSVAQQQAFLDTVSHIRGYREVIAGEFGRCFVESFDRRVKARANYAVETPSDEFSGDALQLVETTVMDEIFLIGDLARDTANKVNPDQALGVHARIAHLLGVEKLDDHDNPLASKAFYEALQSACGAIPGDFTVKRLVLTAFEPYVTRGIDAAYAEINQALIAQQVLPKVRRTVQRHDQTGAFRAAPGSTPGAAFDPSSTQTLVPGAAARGTTGPSGARTPSTAVQYLIAAGMRPPNRAPSDQTESEQIDLAQALTNTLDAAPEVRLMVARMLSEPVRYAFESAIRTPASPALVSTLTEMQALPTFGSVGPDYLANLEPSVREQSHPLDLLTIEFVTMVFELMLSDKALPETVKALIARLQIVAVKTAILDRTFFARREHPMRQLLRKIAASGADPAIDTEPGSAFVEGLREIVKDIVRGFAEDLSIFIAAQDALAELLKRVEASQSSALQSETDALEKKEQRDIAFASAMAELRRRVTAATPAFVQTFLFDSWSHALIDAFQREGDVEDSWTHRLGVADALVWSVSPRSPTEIKQLATMLPQLMKGLRRGMAAAGVAEDTSQAFFADLMQAHAATIAAAKLAARGQPAESPPSAAAPQSVLPPSTALTTEPAAPSVAPAAAAVPSVAPAAAAATGEPAAVFDNPITIDEGPMARVIDEPITLKSGVLSDADDDESELGSSRSSTHEHFRHQVAALELGALAVFDEGGQQQLVKLTWVSPMQTIYLFSSARTKARSMSVDALVEALYDGSVRIIDRSEELVDRVVRELIDEAAPDTVALAS